MNKFSIFGIEFKKDEPMNKADSIFSIKKTLSTPEISFNKDKAYLKIHGRSYSETPEIFYGLVKDLITPTLVPLTITIELEYVNTASSKCLLNLLRELKDHQDINKVIWISEEDDEDMADLGENMECLTNLHFEYRIFI
jgi:hypothetical protein